MRIIIDYLLYILARLLYFIINLMPDRIALVPGRLAGRLLFFLLRSRRNIALGNLRHAFRERLSDREIRKIAVASFENLGLLAVELLKIPEWSKDLKKYVTIEGEEITWNELDKGNGLICLVAHFGNWEIMGAMAGVLGYPMVTVGRPLKYKRLYRFLESLRGITGLPSIDKQGAAKKILQNLHQNRAVVMLVDQYAGSDGIFIPFFGREASTTPAPFRFARKVGCSVIPVFNVREDDGKHRIYVGNPLELVDTGDERADLRENISRYTAILESWIRRYPDHWLWMHRRWKDRRPQ